MAKKPTMKNGFMKRVSGDIDFYTAQKIYIKCFCEDELSLYWRGIKKATPIGKYIPVKYHSTPDSFTIKIVK